MIDIPPEPIPTEEQIIEQQLAECGLKADGFSVKYEDYLQSIEVVFTPKAGAGVEDFECISNAVGYELVSFLQADIDRAYRKYKYELAQPIILEEAKNNLESIGKLKGFPTLSDFENLQGYALALEVHLGFQPGSALRVEEDAILIQPTKDELEAFLEKNLNLMTAVAFAIARDRVPFYLVGNEQFRLEPYQGQ